MGSNPQPHLRAHVLPVTPLTPASTPAGGCTWSPRPEEPSPGRCRHAVANAHNILIELLASRCCITTSRRKAGHRKQAGAEARSSLGRASRHQSTWPFASCAYASASSYASSSTATGHGLGARVSHWFCLQTGGARAHGRLPAGSREDEAVHSNTKTTPAPYLGTHLDLSQKGRVGRPPSL